MTPAELLIDLQNAGAVVFLNAGKLRVDAAPGALSFAQVGYIKQMRDDLCDLLNWDAERATVLRREALNSVARAMPDGFEFPDDSAAWRTHEAAIEDAIALHDLPAMRAALVVYEDFARGEFARWRDEQDVIDLDVFDFESLPIPKYN